MEKQKCRICEERHALSEPCKGLKGKTPEIMIVDDPSDPGSEIGREAAKAWFKEAFPARLTNPSTGDGIALTSIAHPPGLIEKLAKEIRGGKLCLCPCCVKRRAKIKAAVQKFRKKINKE